MNQKVNTFGGLYDKKRVADIQAKIIIDQSKASSSLKIARTGIENSTLHRGP